MKGRLQVSAAAVVAAAAFTVAACGGSDSDSGGGATKAAVDATSKLSDKPMDLTFLWFDWPPAKALEELGITDLDLDFVLTMQRSQFGPAVEERVDWFFTARSWTGEPRIVEPDKAESLGWFALDALPEPMVPHEAHALAHLSSGVGYLTFGWDARQSGGGPSATAATGSTETQGGNR